MLALGWLVAAALVVSACGAGTGASDSGATEAVTTHASTAQAAMEHIHGLGLDPGTGALYVATHEGLFRASRGSTRLGRVGVGRQDVMGFSVAAPGRLIGSGHPAPGQQSPADLGLIASRDGGLHWRTVSLAGEADFHVLRSSGRRVYGFNGATGELMASADAGRAWTRHTPPAPMFDLAISPADARQIVASTERGIFASKNAGRDWVLLRDDAAGLLAWPAPGDLFLIDGQGRVARSADGGRRFRQVGSIGGQPSAFASDSRTLYAALASGTVVRSTDGGAHWRVRAAP